MAIATKTTPFEQNLMFCMGIGILICVPIFKTVTHLPPFMGILFGLGILWLVGELMHSKKDDEAKEHLTLVRALRRIDMSSIVFFIGILLAVATLEHTHILTNLAGWLNKTVGREDVIVTIIGLVSAIVDNVPLVAASMGMYSLAQYPTDSFPLGVHGLLRRHRRLDPDHRLGGRRGGHGAGEDPFLLVCEADQRPGAGGIFRRDRCLYRPVQNVSLTSEFIFQR